jgi:hypothetical protein
VTIHISFADLFAALAWVGGGVAFVWLFSKWMLRAARGAPKPKPPRRSATEYQRGWREGWRRAVWFWWW